MIKHRRHLNWYVEVADAVREAVAGVRGLDRVPEKERLRAIDDGLETVLSEVRMRLEELKPDIFTEEVHHAGSLAQGR